MTNLVRVLALFLAFVTAHAATAQAWDGPGAQTVSYPTSGSTYTGVLGDGSDSKGGIAPALLTQPEAIASNFTVADWHTNTSISRTALTNLASQQAKVRFTCGPANAGKFDIILAPGVINWGHEHSFVGRPMKYTTDTYAELRSSGFSNCPGGPINRTAYWEPGVMFKGLMLKPMLNTFYYSTERGSDAAKMQVLARGLAFIGGTNPADPTDAARKAEVPAGFTYLGNGFKGWKCYQSDNTTLIPPDAGGTYADGFVTAGGQDPWGGRCTAGSYLLMTVLAPECWDGKNLTSPNGRDHFRYKIAHNNSGTKVCPNGWYEVPVFEETTRYVLKIDAEYFVNDWHLSSDRMDPNPANWLRRGTSGHFDWKNGWDQDILNRWLVRCIGIDIPGSGLTAQPADCGFNTVDDTIRLKQSEQSPDQARWPGAVVKTPDYSQNDSLRWYPPVGKGPYSGHAHSLMGMSHDEGLSDAERVALALLAILLAVGVVLGVLRWRRKNREAPPVRP